MDPFHDRRRVSQRTARPRVLDQHAEPVALERLVRVAHRHVDSERCGTGPHHRNRLRMAVRVDEEPRRLRLRDASRHRHRFGRRRRLVEQRGVGEFHSGQIHDHLLEVEKGFQPSLAHLRLIRRVRRVPGRILEDVAQHHRRSDGAVVAHPDHRDEGAVPLRHRPQRLNRLALGQRRTEVERFVVAYRCGDGPVEQLPDTRDADDFQHGFDVVRGGADVTRCEVIPHLERIERAGLGHGFRFLSLVLQDVKRALRRIGLLSCGAHGSDHSEPRRFNRHLRTSLRGAFGCSRSGRRRAGRAMRLLSRAIRCRSDKPPRPSVRRAPRRP